MKGLSPVKRCVWVIFAVLLVGMTSSRAADIKPLVIADQSRVVADKGDYIILMLDLHPNREDLARAGADASDVIVATATAYAREYLAKSEFSHDAKAVVYLVSIDNMDEYQHANFDGMKKFGTLTFERRNKDVAMTENKLSFKP